MFRFGALLMCGLLTSLAFAQQEGPDHPGEIYALASSAAGPNIPKDMPAAGFVIGGAWKPSPKFGVVADFDRHFVSDTHVSFNSFLAGPRRCSEEHFRLSGFVQILAGARETAFTGLPAAWTFALAPGAGVDVRLTDSLAWRAGQLDVILSRDGITLRASSGFAFRFGR